MLLRLEHPETGQGPFCGAFAHNVDNYIEWNHPGPHNDGMGRRMFRNERSAVRDVQELNEWFTNIPAMLEAGYEVLLVDAPHVKHCGIQAVFDNRTATKKVLKPVI